MTHIHVIAPILVYAGLVIGVASAQDRNSMYPFDETAYEPAQFAYGIGPDTGAYLFNKPPRLGDTQWIGITSIYNPVSDAERPDATVFFPFDSSVPINPEVLQTIPRLSAHRIQLIARTDPVGTAPYNDVLSQQRAETVTAILVELGVPRANIDIQAMGSRSPIGEVHTEEGRATNRQVFVHLRGRQ